MTIICDRKDKIVQHYSELNSNELYCPSHLSQKGFYKIISDGSLSKRISDPWEHKNESGSFKTYADYFEKKAPNVRIKRDSLLATMKGVKKPRINYLKGQLKRTVDESNDSEKQIVYYPIELLHYAPLNSKDYELIYQLPSILVRISQLYRIERLRKLLADNIQYYPVSLIHLRCVFKAAVRSYI